MRAYLSEGDAWLDTMNKINAEMSSVIERCSLQTDRETLKKQCEGLQREYNRIADQLAAYEVNSLIIALILYILPK